MASTYATKGGPRYRGRIWIGGREVTKAGFVDREAAERWEKRHRGTTVSPKTTLADYLASGARDAVMAQLSPATRRTYASNLKVRILPALGDSSLDAISPGMIQRAQIAWTASGRAASTVNGTLNTLSRVLGFATKDRILLENPMSEVERAKDDFEVYDDLEDEYNENAGGGNHRRGDLMDVLDVEQFASAADAFHPEYGDYVRAAAYTGARAGELCALNVADVDFSRRVVRIRRAYSAGVLKKPKAGEAREVPITDQLRPLLERLTAGRAANAPLLRGPRGRRINHSVVRNRLDWVRFVAGQGWPGFRFHDLRATAIVTWIHAGVENDGVRAMAGHASLRTTDLYVRLTRSGLDSAANRINVYTAAYTKPYIES